MSPIELYYNCQSPVCRLARIAFEELQIPVNVINKDWLDLLDLDFLKLNPRHKIPCIVDDGFILTESRAIITYLVNKYKPNHFLYPEEPKTRAEIDSWLYFDNGVTFPYLEIICMPNMYSRTEAGVSGEEVLHRHLSFLDLSLKDRKYFVGDVRTFADLACMCNLTYLESYGEKATGVLKPYLHIQKWLSNLKQELPYYSTLIQQPIKETVELVKAIENPDSDILARYSEKSKIAKKYLQDMRN